MSGADVSVHCLTDAVGSQHLWSFGRTLSKPTSRARSRRCGGHALRVVVDTNVWVSGLINPASVPGKVLELVRAGRVQAVASWGFAEEIVEVLRRPRLRRYRITERDVADVLVVLAPLLPDVDIEVEPRDPGDAPVVSAAVAAAADMIVTGDHGLLEDGRLRRWLEQRGVDMRTPAEFVEEFGA